jgi:hypothetical protein
MTERRSVYWTPFAPSDDTRDPKLSDVRWLVDASLRRNCSELATPSRDEPVCAGSPVVLRLLRGQKRNTPKGAVRTCFSLTLLAIW